MLRQASRLHHTIFSKPPLERRRFRYGVAALYRNPKGTLAVIVSKKIAKGAVERNRIQRRMRHAFKRCTNVEYGVALYPTKEVLSAPFPDLLDALVEVLRTR